MYEVALKNVVILILRVIRDDDKFYQQLFFFLKNHQQHKIGGKQSKISKSSEKVGEMQ